MRRIKDIFVAAAIAVVALFASCSNDGNDASVGNLGNRNALTLLSNVTEESPRVWQAEDKVGIYVYSGEESVASNVMFYNASYNAKYANFFVDNADQLIEYVDGKNYEVMAYYPYIAEGTSFDLDVTDQQEIVNDDFIITERTAVTKGGDESLKFVSKPSYSLLGLSFFVKDGDVVSKADMSNSVVTIGGAVATASYDFMSDKITLGGDVAQIVGVSCEKGSNQASVTMIPQSVENLTISVMSTDFGTLTETLPLSTLAAAELYPLEITIEGETLSISAGNINDWNDNDIIDGSAFDTTIRVGSLTLSSESVKVNLKGSAMVTLEATVMPENATNKNIIWTSSNEEVAVVTNGVVKGVALGRATIKATSADDDEIFATCEISIIDEAVIPIVVGDFLYADFTYGSVYDETKALYGVVCSVDEAGRAGIVISPYSEHMEWATAGTKPATTYLGTSTDLGAVGIGVANMKAAYAGNSNSFDDMPAYQYVTALNDPATDYAAISDTARGVWYLPSEGEMKSIICPAIFVDKVVNASIAQVADGMVMECGGAAGYYLHTSSAVGAAQPGKIRNVFYTPNNTTLKAGGIVKTNAGLWARPVMNFSLDDAPYYCAGKE